MSPRLTLALLGPVEVLVDGALAGGFDYNKVRALLAYLAVEASQPHSRLQLCGLLWPESPERTARQNLSQALTRLRQALGDKDAAQPLVLASTDFVQLNPEAEVEVDVARFSALIQACEAHAPAHRGWHLCTPCAVRLRQAVALYRGDFLAQFYIDDSAPFEEWALLVRERQRQRMLSAVERLAAYADWRGRYEEAAEHTRRAVELEPWLETNQRELMRRLALGGQTTAALAQYDHLRRMLAEALDAAPEAETTQLYEQIRGGSLPQPAVARRGAGRLPAPPTRLIGREAALAEALALLQRDDVRALTLVGAPGIGKTRLALALAAELQFEFEDGVCWVDLAPLAEAALVPAAVAQALGVREQPGKALAATLQAALRRSHLLLVLDNCEHVLQAGTFVAELLAHCPDVRLLATSRIPLAIRAERQFALAPLALPAATPDPEAPVQAPAVELFLERAQAVRPGFRLTAEQAEPVGRICARVDGLPLAIELIAGRAKTRAPAELLGELEHGLAALTHGSRDLPARQRTLRLALAWSFDLLSPDEQEIFAHLGVFAGGFTADALSAMLDPAGGCVPVSAEALEGLQQASLLQAAEAAGEARYSLLETTREFALEQLERGGQADRARQRHADYFLALAQQAEPELNGPDQRRWFDRLEREEANLRAALAWSQARDPDLHLRLASALSAFWLVRGRASEGWNWLSAGLESAGQAAPHTLAGALAASGRLAFRLGDLPKARELLGQAREAFLRLEDSQGLIPVLVSLGIAVVRQGDFPAGQALLEEALRLARSEHDAYWEAGALNGLAEVALRQGDPARDQALTRQALALHQARRDPRNTAGTLMNLGVAEYEAGDFQAARRSLEASLAAGRELDDYYLVALALVNLGSTLIALERPADARACLEEAIARYRAHHNRNDADSALGALGRALEKLGDLAASRARQAEALRIRAESGNRYHLAVSLVSLASLDWREKRHDRAARLLGAADAIRAALGAPVAQARRAEYDELLANVRAALGTVAFEGARAAGRALRTDEAVALALGEAAPA